MLRKHAQEPATFTAAAVHRSRSRVPVERKAGNRFSCCNSEPLPRDARSPRLRRRFHSGAALLECREEGAPIYPGRKEFQLWYVPVLPQQHAAVAVVIAWSRREPHARQLVLPAVLLQPPDGAAARRRSPAKGGAAARCQQRRQALEAAAGVAALSPLSRVARQRRRKAGAPARSAAFATLFARASIHMPVRRLLPC